MYIKMSLLNIRNRQDNWIVAFHQEKKECNGFLSYVNMRLYFSWEMRPHDIPHNGT